MLSGNLQEFEELDYYTEQAYYIRCPDCHANQPEMSAEVSHGRNEKHQETSGHDNHAAASQNELSNNASKETLNEKPMTLSSSFDADTLKRKLSHWTYSEPPAKTMRTKL